ncbi:hypothetical protein K439DRAFT_1611815 [Ramaria rubella]|nr:hypothetical protein K439DRAFT_1611815 [Ramaria rubella]
MSPTLVQHRGVGGLAISRTLGSSAASPWLQDSRGANKQGERWCDWAFHQQGVGLESVTPGMRRQQTGREVGVGWLVIGRALGLLMACRERGECGQACHQRGVGLESVAPGAWCQQTGRKVGVGRLVVGRVLGLSTVCQVSWTCAGLMDMERSKSEGDI